MATSRGESFETHLHELLDAGEFRLGPVAFVREELEINGADGVLRATLDGRPIGPLFVFEAKSTWTRRTRSQAASQLRRAEHRLQPLLIAPYWSTRELNELRTEDISAVDVCGNGLLMAPPKLFVFQSGAPKKKELAPRPQRISIYDSSNISNLVPRVLFAQEVFPTTTAILKACHARMMPLSGRPPRLTLATVSRALRVLDEDLVTARHGRERRLIDQDRLREYLRRDFRMPTKSPTTFKTRLSHQAVFGILDKLRPDTRFVVTGRGSAQHHTGLAGPDRLQLYVSDLERVASALDARPTRAFPNLELAPTEQESPFFNPQHHDGIPWSSRLQCYLELAHLESGPREQDVAEELRTSGRFG